MNALEIKHQIFVKQWAAELEEFKNSGMSVKDWCQANNIPQSTFSMHRRAVRDAACTAIEKTTGNNISELISQNDLKHLSSTEPTAINFAQVHLKSSSSNIMHIQIRNASIDIGPCISADQLRIMLEVILHAQ